MTHFCDESWADTAALREAIHALPFNVELAQGTRIEITDPVLQRIEASLHELVPEATDVITSAGSGGGPGHG